MQQKVFAVLDTQVKAFMQPFFSPTVGSATRAFRDAVNDPSTMLNKHPADYVLYEIGTWDDETGVIECQTPQQIGPAVMFKEDK